MKKVLVSILALAMMLSCFCTINVFADGVTPTITAKNAAGEVVGTYSTIDTAANAAGVNGTVVLSEGTFEFNGRQTIAVAGITLEGAGKGVTFIKTSANFVNASATNKKALLTITANNVTVKDLSIDASLYGNSINPAVDEFNVVRINSGTGIVLDDIYVTGSLRTLISIGSGSASATVTATDLDCQAEHKAIPQLITVGTTTAYADIDITKGSFTLNSGVVNGFIQKAQNATFVNNAASGTPKYYKFTKSILIFEYMNVTTTMRHFVESYYAIRGTASSDNMTTFVNAVLDNVSKIQGMTNEAVAGHDTVLINKFIAMLGDVLDVEPDDDISACKTQLENALNP